MINQKSACEMGLRRIVTSCQLQQVSSCSILDMGNPEHMPISKSIQEQAFIPFSIDVIGQLDKKTDYIGEFSGYLCEYQPSYSNAGELLTLEDIAIGHPDPALLAFTTAVLGDKGKMPSRWCRPGEYFALLCGFQIYPAFRGAGIGLYILDNIQKIIRFDCCIPIHCVFIPPPKPCDDDEDGKSYERLKTSLRRLGYREIGHGGAGYFAQRVNPEF